MTRVVGALELDEIPRFKRLFGTVMASHGQVERSRNMSVARELVLAARRLGIDPDAPKLMERLIYELAERARDPVLPRPFPPAVGDE